MSARDDFGSRAGTGGGFGGGLGNGGVGGGMGGGYSGGGAGRNGGFDSRTGLTTGTQWNGNTAWGRPGGSVQAYGMRDPRSLAAAGMGPTMGQFSNFRTPQGQAMFPGMPGSFSGMNMGQALGQAQNQWGLLQSLMSSHASPTGSAPPGVPQQPVGMTPPPPVIEDVPLEALTPWPGQGVAWSVRNAPTYRGLKAAVPTPGNVVPKNNMGDYAGYGNVSTQYKNNQGTGLGGGSTMYKNNQGTGLGGGSTMYKNNQGGFGNYGNGSTHYKNGQ